MELSYAEKNGSFLPPLPKELVKGPLVPPFYNVNANGTRFLLTRLAGASTNAAPQSTNGLGRINLVFNWFSELAKP
jgi:hypothetical protein